MTINTYTGTNAALDIALGGTLGVQANIVNHKKITIEGTLQNDAPVTSPATTYTLSGSGGSIGMTNGLISSQNGGIWSIGQAISGSGTISGRLPIAAP